MISEFNILNVMPINLDCGTTINLIEEGIVLIEEKDTIYLVVKKNLPNSILNIPDNFTVRNAKVEAGKNENTDFIFKNANYGGKGSFIFDMNGIDNFRYARSMIFSDDMIRRIILKMNLLNSDSQYLRIGAAGAPNVKAHPGGEVFEYSLINGNDLSGISISHSGYLPSASSEYSRRTKLSFDDNILLDERSVYSHTAWIKSNKVYLSGVKQWDITINEDGQSLLDVITEVSLHLSLKCFSIQIYLEGTDLNGKILIKGRVLKHVPYEPFKILQDATDIAVEKSFYLPVGSKFYGVGTKYDRYEPEWEVFTGGRKYEQRGHIHATIIHTANDQIHETFHLRDIILNKGSKFSLILTPIDNIYRAYPVYKKGKELCCSSTDKNVKNLINEIKEYDKLINGGK